MTERQMTRTRRDKEGQRGKLRLRQCKQSTRKRRTNSERWTSKSEEWTLNTEHWTRNNVQYQYTTSVILVTRVSLSLHVVTCNTRTTSSVRAPVSIHMLPCPLDVLNKLFYKFFKESFTRRRQGSETYHPVYNVHWAVSCVIRLLGFHFTRLLHGTG